MERLNLFDFGRSDFDNQGLRAFKSGWGTTEGELVYSSFGNKPFRPLEFVTTVPGPVIQHSPMLLNRALGHLPNRFAS